jgi:hypothetical protein
MADLSEKFAFMVVKGQDNHQTQQTVTEMFSE